MHFKDIFAERIVWSHLQFSRYWNGLYISCREHDKDPDTFFQVIYQLIEQGGLNFRISVIGESYSEKPTIFNEAQQKLANYILNWGYVESKQK